MAKEKVDLSRKIEKLFPEKEKSLKFLKFLIENLERCAKEFRKTEQQEESDIYTLGGPGKD